MQQLLILISCIIIVYFLYRYLKPYLIKYDTTLLFCGGLGSGKTLNSVKYALILLRKNRSKIKLKNLKIQFFNLFSKDKKEFIEMPVLYSNIPIKINKNEYSVRITKDILTLKKRIIEYSVVLLDELPLIVNQFNWNITEVQNNLNEFVALFRHYVGGYLIVNGQSESEIVKQIRAKLNSYYWCYNFQKFLCFYRVRILHNVVSEYNVSMSTDFIEDKTKWTYGIINKHYNTRAYKNRYSNINEINVNQRFYNADLTTNKIIRFNEKYKSPCDDKESL